MYEDSLSGELNANLRRISTREEPIKQNLVQLSLKHYVTYHSKFRSTDNAATPKSTKFHKGNKVPFVNLKNISSPTNEVDQNGEERIRKRSASTIFDCVNETSLITINNENEYSWSYKRRRSDAFNFECEGQVPNSIISHSNMQICATRTFNDSASSDDFNHYVLPIVERPQIENRAFASISGETLINCLTSMSAEEFENRFVLVDCRYPYEYNGGHIKNAINIHDPEKIQEIFFPSNPVCFRSINAKYPIFYCEFSQKRSVQMAMELRRQDRRRNVYPALDYKEIYILDYGYRRFYLEDGFTQFCIPSNYVPMIDERYTEELKQYRQHKKKAAQKCMDVQQPWSFKFSDTFSHYSEKLFSTTKTTMFCRRSSTAEEAEMEEVKNEEEFFGFTDLSYEPIETCPSRLSILSQLEGCLSRVNLDMSLK